MWDLCSSQPTGTACTGAPSPSQSSRTQWQSSDRPPMDPTQSKEGEKIPLVPPCHHKVPVVLGRKGGHKGRARQYTSPEEIDAQLQAEKQKAREEEEQEEGGEGATGDPKKEKKSLDSDESDEDDEDYQQKRKGVEGLIDIENPNRVVQATKKVTQLDLDGPKELSRREREEIEKQKAKERYMKMHLAGKTEQAKADLARLAIIRKQREEAARKKEEERKG
ncbi:28 kDa heat- and acid-stable phosphoprotein [Willisornis vidua]|uniref:28 kDa heat- and acid-stable phosphoprotein n=1 Tax=Willisornis vidua TaxID=1566151 RepID=A0ABQ9CPV6_9PASS|nr:28 kDa heat- and acid-stable phosphoprotein [Willisornis vidua]